MKKIDYTYSGILVKQNNKPDSISITTNKKKGAALSHRFYKMFANSVVASPDPIVAYINPVINFTSEMIWCDFETKRIFSLFNLLFSHLSIINQLSVKLKRYICIRNVPCILLQRGTLLVVIYGAKALVCGEMA